MRSLLLGLLLASWWEFVILARDVWVTR